MAARVSELASGQWGLLTTAQAEKAGVSRLQLARLADAGVIERIDRGIYVTPAAVDERTPLRSAWLSLEPKVTAEERLGDPVSSGVLSHTSAAALYEIGDLLGDQPEITVPERKQSRRAIRLHRSALDANEVTIVQGLPVTTPQRTVADLLRDGHDPSHVAEIAGDVIRRGLASRQDMAIALDPLARRNGHRSGTALLDHLLDLVGLSGTALAANLAASDLGKALVSAGQIGAIRKVMEAVTALNLPKDALDSLHAAAMSAITKDAVVLSLPDDVLPSIDLSAIVEAAKLAVPVDAEAFRRMVEASISTWFPDVARSLPANSPPSNLATAGATKKEESSRGGVRLMYVDLDGSFMLRALLHGATLRTACADRSLEAAQAPIAPSGMMRTGVFPAAVRVSTMPRAVMTTRFAVGRAMLPSALRSLPTSASTSLSEPSLITKQTHSPENLSTMQSISSRPRSVR